MYISKKNREIIKQKFGGKCAYTGTELKDDWQVDHVEPLIRNWWDNQSMKLSCFKTSLRNGEGIKAAQVMYAWIME